MDPSPIAVPAPVTVNPNEQVRSPVEASIPQTGESFWPGLLKFLSTDAGREINSKLAEWIGALREGQQQKHVVELVSTISRYCLMAGIMASAVWLQHEKQLDSAVTGLLGLALGYLFGRQGKEE